MEKTIKNGRAMPAPTLWDHVPTMPVGATIARPLYGFLRTSDTGTPQ